MDEIGKRERDDETIASEVVARRDPSPAVTRPGNREKALELLRQWREEGDSAEEQESLEELMDAMNESRSGQRVPFPDRLRSKQK